MASSIILPPWHPTMPNEEIKDMQLILQWEAEEKEVWEETAIRTAVKTHISMGIPVTYSEERAAFVVIRNKGVMAYSGIVASIVASATQWMRDNPLNEDEEMFNSFVSQREEAYAGW